MENGLRLARTFAMERISCAEARTTGPTILESFLTIVVVYFALLCVGQDLVCVSQIFKLIHIWMRRTLSYLFRITTLVWMFLDGLPSEGSLYVCLWSLAIDS